MDYRLPTWVPFLVFWVDACLPGCRLRTVSATVSTPGCLPGYVCRFCWISACYRWNSRLLPAVLPIPGSYIAGYCYLPALPACLRAGHWVPACHRFWMPRFSVLSCLVPGLLEFLTCLPAIDGCCFLPACVSAAWNLPGCCLPFWVTFLPAPA